MPESSLPANQMTRLTELWKVVRAENGFYRRKLEEAGGEDLRLEDPSSLHRHLRKLPFTTKKELQEDQERHPPWGTNLSYPQEDYIRFHRTSGTSGRPMAWLDTRESWDWVLQCWKKIYAGLGIVPIDVAFFPFSFGPFLGFWSAFEGALRCGCLCIPGGGMSTLSRLQVILEQGVTVVAATPTYALRMAQVAASEGIDLAASRVRALIVAGEPGGSVPGTKDAIEQGWGARCFDHCGMTEVGPVGYECQQNPGGMHVLEDEYIVEVLDPRTAEPFDTVDSGSVVEGELVLTGLGRKASPLIRYRTGDLVRWSREPCTCGSPCGRLEGGILGRIDDMIFIRGNNLYPSAIDAVMRQFADVAEYRVRVRLKKEMSSLLLEVEPLRDRTQSATGRTSEEDLRRRIQSAVETTFLFRPEVTIVPRGTLPRFEHKANRWIQETADS